MRHEDGFELPVLPRRLQRLADELDDEGLPILDGAPDRLAALVELAYALRPPQHEGRVPTYGAILPTNSMLDSGDHTSAWGTSVNLIPVRELDVQFARRFADGITSFAVRSTSSIDHLASFGRNIADEHDLVGLQATTGGIIVQRHPTGQVRVFAPGGVVRWDGTTWHHDEPVDAWIARLSSIATDLPVEGLRPLLRFAIHELGGRRIGAILIWRPVDEAVPTGRFEALVHNAPTLQLDRVGEESALASALAQTDGAAVFDRAMRLTSLGIRLAPSIAAERHIGTMQGTRHTSALRYSYDDPQSIVIVVSDAGPVTLMHHGHAVTSVDPASERIG